jgi:hypothetical protein
LVPQVLRAQQDLTQKFQDLLVRLVQLVRKEILETQVRQVLLVLRVMLDLRVQLAQQVRIAQLKVQQGLLVQQVRILK